VDTCNPVSGGDISLLLRSEIIVQKLPSPMDSGVRTWYLWHDYLAVSFFETAVAEGQKVLLAKNYLFGDEFGCKPYTTFCINSEWIIRSKFMKIRNDC